MSSWLLLPLLLRATGGFVMVPVRPSLQARPVQSWEGRSVAGRSALPVVMQQPTVGEPVEDSRPTCVDDEAIEARQRAFFETMVRKGGRR